MHFRPPMTHSNIHSNMHMYIHMQAHTSVPNLIFVPGLGRFTKSFQRIHDDEFLTFSTYLICFYIFFISFG